MTLRLRMVVGLVILVLTGLAIFGISTYALYSRSEHDRLDDRLRTAVPVVTSRLFEIVGITPESGRSIGIPLGTYSELHDADGVLIKAASADGSEHRPILPELIADPGRDGRLFTIGSAVGSGDWRVAISRVGTNFIVVVALPMQDVDESLDRLVLIEASAASGLLVILAVGSWFILRRGLRPLEQMADSARSITAGGLSQRVAPADERTEVGQLGMALNTMLGELEAAFNERDATERKLRQFLADASHELRTPLTSIQGFAELFRLGADHPDLDLAVVLRRIEQESARMKVLVDDLLMLARLDQRRPAERTAVDLSVLAADACSDIRATGPDRAVTLDAPEPVVISGDVGLLRQALANLVTNAVRHTPAGTPIAVSVRREAGVACVRVRDHGGGLDDEALAHVFDRFWQADAARVGTGSGLGLSIVEGIATEHGGSISADNAPGGGAVFTLRLPHSDSPP